MEDEESKLEETVKKEVIIEGTLKDLNFKSFKIMGEVALKYTILIISVGALALAGLKIKNLSDKLFPEQEEPYVPLEERYRENLVINYENLYRTVIHKSKKEGIKDMLKLISSSKLEEGWAYFSKDSIWVEIMKNEKIMQTTNDGYTATGEFDLPYLKKIMKENDNLTLYHIHPSDQKFDTDNLSESRIEEMRKSREITTAIPSGEDISSLIGLSLTYHDINPKGKLKYAVCSERGVIEFGLTEKGMKHHLSDDAISPHAKGIIIRQVSLLFGASEKEGSVNYHISNICNVMDDDEMSVKFMPHPTL